MTSATLSMRMPCNPTAPRGRVLCVDDEPNVLRALHWLLQKDFDVSTATSGQEGLKLVRESSFDVVISDQRMPEMSGVDFLREVRAIAPRAMRILLTGYSDMQAILRSVNESEMGTKTVLPKAAMPHSMPPKIPPVPRCVRQSTFPPAFGSSP